VEVEPSAHEIIIDEMTKGRMRPGKHWASDPFCSTDDLSL
jgi:hypothetical protein